MKRLLLTVAVASLTVSSAFALPGGNKGKEGGKSATPKTREEAAREEAKKSQAVSPAVAQKTRDNRSTAENLVNISRTYSGGEATKSATVISAAIDANKISKTEVDAIAEKAMQNDRVAVAMSEVIIVGANKNQLDGVLAFVKGEGISYITGKTAWDAKASEKLAIALEATKTELAQSTGAKQVKLVDALTRGLELAGFDKETIREILKKCFKIG